MMHGMSLLPKVMGVLMNFELLLLEELIFSESLGGTICPKRGGWYAFAQKLLYKSLSFLFP